MRFPTLSIACCLFSFGCIHSANTRSTQPTETDVTSNQYTANTQALTVSDTFISISTGTVSEGALINGKSVPFNGRNFTYFDSASFKYQRCYLNDKVLAAVLRSYHDLEKKAINRHFRIMECSNKHGGTMYPHRTHQNGLSVDFMVPLIKNNKPYYEYDALGGNHYLLDFDNSGRLMNDTLVRIDFEVLARHIISLDSICQSLEMGIQKVILKTEFKELLFNTPSGNLLKSQNIYFAQKLTPLINELHDDHYHIDFKIL